MTQVRAEDRARVVGRAQAVGPADRQARPGRAEARVHRRHGVRPRGDASTSPAAWPTTSATTSASRRRWPSSTAPSSAGRPSTTMVQVRGGRGYETAESLRRARREAGPGRAAAARHAHQPDLRGLDGDHAPADRPRGRRPAPAGRRRRARPGDAGRRQGQGRAPRPARSTPSGSRQLAVGDGHKPGVVRRVRRRCAKHLRYVERALAQARPLDLLPHGPLPGAAWSRRAHLLGPDRRHRRRAVRDRRARASTRETIAREHPSARERRPSSPTSSASQARRRADALFAELWANDDDAQYTDRAAGSSTGRYTWFEDDVLDPAGDGPMIPQHEKPAATRSRSTRPGTPWRMPAAPERTSTC